MEFLRFGSSIPGTYWGCCAIDIIQNFKVDPDAPYGIQLVSGDSGTDMGDKYLGKTYREVFWARLRIGTFATEDMPNHAFIATMTSWQLYDTNGKKWLAILKEAGFEFIRAIDNSVYSGRDLYNEVPEEYDPDSDYNYGESSEDGYPNYVFALFRNIGSGRISDPFTPPEEWTSLPSVKKEAWEFFDKEAYKGNITQEESDFDIWKDMPPIEFYSKQELLNEGIPVEYAGVRSEFPQELVSKRDAKKAIENSSISAAPPSVFPVIGKPSEELLVVGSTL